jgi:uncharacterized protein Yka (UPF0111/DUF47 family)
MFGSSKKDHLFYDAFRDLAKVAVDAATKFTKLLDDVQSAQRVAESIREDKKRGDEIFRRTLRELHATWITPLDRPRIHELVAGVAGVLKLIDSTATRIILFGIREVRADAQDLAKNLADACQRILATMELIPKLSKDHAEQIIRLAGEIHEIEGRSDAVHQRALSSIFDGSCEPLQVMKWREVFDNLEDATNVCRDIAHLFEAIVLENA